MNDQLSLINHREDGFCRVNSIPQSGAPNGETLLEWLRDAAHCVDVRKGCDTGHCGTCAVIVDGMPVKSCSVMAREVQTRDVFTLSGLPMLKHRPTVVAVLDATERLRPFQCAYCSPAFIIAAVDLLQDMPSPTEAAIREAFTGLLCRCTGYQPIVDMVLLAADLLQNTGFRKS
jgi:carbon-monoxide dehydrogenase small subunit